jgi:8-oxo-dGTP pyrophosphatase MutT (NUDIX family)
MKKAVCVLLHTIDGNIVVVSRRNDTTKWGLPGGKVDPGETLLEAILRETREEIGFVLDPSTLSPILTAVCPGEVPYEVTTFSCSASVDLQMLLAEPELVVGSSSEYVLTNPNLSPFAEYNKKVFEAIAKR